MDKNHDARKQQTNASIRRSGKIALVIAILILLGQIISFLYKVTFTLRQPDTLEDQSFLGYLNYIRYGTVPDLIVRIVLTLGTMLPLILLLRDISRKGLPFTIQNGTRMFIAGIMQGLLALLPVLFHFVQMIRYGDASDTSSLAYLIQPNVLNYLNLSFCFLLLFLAGLFRYGAALQQESDETL